MKDQRIIFHVDVNSAFLSWSAVKRLQEDPGCLDLRTVPSVVAGDQATRHGIVTAKSIPAKKYGIRTAEPVAQAMRKCPGLIVISSDFTTYRKFSSAFIRILKSYTPLVEKASIDEAYMDVSDLKDRYETDGTFPVCLAEKIKDEIRDTLGFTVNIGISTNKLLAKMASDFQKPDRIHTLYPQEIREKMWPLPVSELHGCGAQTAARLNSAGIFSIGEAASVTEGYLQDLLGEKAGSYIWNSANGISSGPVRVEREEAKSISNEETTAFDITPGNYEQEMPPLVRKLSDKVAGRLKKAGLYAGTIQVSVKTNDFKRRSMQSGLEDMTDDPDRIYHEAIRLFGKLLLGKEKGLFQETEGIRLVGVGVTDLSHGEFRQMNLQDFLEETERKAGEKNREKVLDTMLEKIRGRYGKTSISRGVPDEKQGSGRI